MSWVDDRLDDQKRSERDRALISLQAEKVYEELWKEISDRVGDAAKRGTPVATNGSNYERTVLAGAFANGDMYRTQPGESRQLTITMERADGKIVVANSTDERSFEIPLKVCENSIVRPSHQGKPLTIPEAAKLILEPFLFPPTPNR